MLLAVVILSKLIIREQKRQLTSVNLKLPWLKEKQCCYKNKAWKIAWTNHYTWRAVSKNKAPVPCCSNLTKKLICVNLPKGTLLSWQSIPPSFRETAAWPRDLAWLLNSKKPMVFSLPRNRHVRTSRLCRLKFYEQVLMEFTHNKR